MLLRRLMLALGVLALFAGIGLAVVSLRTPRQTVATSPQAPPQAVLVAARDLPPATLLRSEDLKYAEVAASAVPPGAFVRGQVPETNVLGAATRRSFKAGEALATDGIIRPNEVGFLPAVLHPGMRAIAIAIDAAAVGAGLIQPGDHVDVLLTQSLSGIGATGEAYRQVGETVLHDIRVIAADQTVNLSGEGQPKTVNAPPRVPQTVTLEVSPEQAQTLMVAHQLGRLQLSLRSLAENAAAAGEPPPTWATQVSPALRELVGGPVPAAAGGGAGSEAANAPSAGPAAGPVAIDILRGTKSEQRCYRGGISVPCGPRATAPGAGAPENEGNPPASPAAAPGKASALTPAATRRPA